jgi:hypothetical protein
MYSSFDFNCPGSRGAVFSTLPPFVNSPIRSVPAFDFPVETQPPPMQFSEVTRSTPTGSALAVAAYPEVRGQEKTEKKRSLLV